MRRQAETSSVGPAGDPSGAVESVLDAQCAGLARKVREREARTIGLAPAGDEVAIPALALRLATALAATAPKPVAVVSARAVQSEPGADPVAAGFVTAWLGPSLAMVTPAPGRLDLGALVAALEDAPRRFDRQVVDLTGLDRLGEEPIVCGVLDALVVVARSGRTRMRQLQRRLRVFPPGRLVGVLLTGP